MALVCDASGPKDVEMKPTADEDLEDGEIEDDDDEEEQAVEPPLPPPAAVAAAPHNQENVPSNAMVAQQPPPSAVAAAKQPDAAKERKDRRAGRHDDKGRKHMTEAEKSILHLRKREKMQREKWEKYRKEQHTGDGMDDDFAKNIEKTMASILSKKEKQAQGIEDKDEKEEDKEKRGRKRKKHKDRSKAKQRRTESPNDEEFDDADMYNVKGGSPLRNDEKRPTDSSADNTNSSDGYSSEKSRPDDRNRKRDKRNNRKNQNRDRNKHKDRDRDRNSRQEQIKDQAEICVFYLQGKCQKNNCPYSHEASPPMKLELCLQCSQGDNCKFAHGKPLSEDLKQILFKHIETAPRDILGGFPRFSREEALNKINQAQQELRHEYGMPDEEGDDGNIPSLFDIDVPVPPELADDTVTQTSDKEKRARRSRWQNTDSQTTAFASKPFPFGKDQDMRITSNGDVDMRTLPPPGLTAPPPDFSTPPPIDIEIYKREAGLISDAPNRDVDIRTLNIKQHDVDIRPDPRLLATKDTDIRQLLPAFDEKRPPPSLQECPSEEENNLQIDTGEDPEPTASDVVVPEGMPKLQRDLYLRIQAQQKDAPPDVHNDSFKMEDNDNWYSDESDDENRLTIKDDDEMKEKADVAKEETVSAGILSPTGTIKPQDVVEKLGDLSKIDISAEVTKLLSSMSKSGGLSTTPAREPEKATPAEPPVSRDPRRAAAAAASSETREPRSDPRQRPRQDSSDSQIQREKVSIYEQGSFSVRDEGIKVDADGKDIDLRNLTLPFKAMQNYTPATEIDASINAHPTMMWKVYIVDIPRPDYSSLKLSMSDAEASGDPRLRKIFRLSTEEKDSPMSPKQESTNSNKPARIDPRLRKQEESKSNDQMNYNQQLNMLLASSFYQSLTSSQKLLLNQELAKSSGDANNHDPVLNGILSKLDIISNVSLQAGNPISNAILASVGKLNNPMMGGQNQNVVNPMMGQPNPMNQPGLLGAAPGIPNMAPDFGMGFDPRNGGGVGGGLLGNAPPQFGNNFPPDNFSGYGDDFYPHEGGPPNRHNGSNRGFNRRRGRGNGFNRNGRNFRHNRNNRSNRSHTPP
ncbi:uncharacterized protein LOC109606230 isoform X3 [Aethina tumida]|uniref:uncharacterized protein LOC109606230 isoform X3 n=1 Tax=Aethina tumida TaxID=116153 RepID=UPI00214746F5|nr:uncharacterized protein LOC109606230 isoform X3 [Aethina tumida]